MDYRTRHGRAEEEQELNLYPCGVQICLAPCGRSDEWKVMRTEAKKIRFSPDEWATVEAKAQAAGITPSAWVRQAALNQLPAKIPELNHEAWVKLAPTLSNLNQLMRYINAGNLPDSQVLLDLLNVTMSCYTEVGAMRLDLLGTKEEDE